MLRSTLRFAAGAAVAIAIWIFTVPMYNSLLAFAAEPLIRIDSRLRNGEVLAAERQINARGGDRQPELPRVIIPADQLTYNFILLTGLFAMERKRLRRLPLALAVLFATHVLALVVSIESTYATRLGPWSESHYGPLEQDFWTAAEYAYRLAGMFAIVFGLWWILGRRAVAGGRWPVAGSR